MALSNDVGLQINAVNWPLCALSGIFLFLRVFLKRLSHRVLWWDDYILILSWCLLVAQSILWSVIIKLGFGERTLSPERLLLIFRLIAIESSLLILASIWSKTSFAITLLRLPIGRLRILVWAIMIAANGFIGLTVLTPWVQCLSADATTNVTTGLHCIPNDLVLPYSIFTGALAAATDFSLALMPVKILWGMQMKTSEKVGAMFAMGMGFFAGIAAIVKVTIYPRILTTPGAGAQVAELGALETALAIMGASLPVLRALFRQVQSVPMGAYDTGDMSMPTWRHGEGRARPKPVISAPSSVGDDFEY